MQGLSLTQPWASLLASGKKKIETRSWGHPSMAHQWLAIHASKKFPRDCRDLCYESTFSRALTAIGSVKPADLPLGAILGVAYLHRIGRISERASDGAVMIAGHDLPVEAGDELEFGDFTPGRFGWVFTNVRRLAEPLPAQGALGLWTVPADIEARIREQLPC